MKKLLFIIALLATTVILASCSKDSPKVDERMTYLFNSTNVVGEGRAGYLEKLSMESEVGDVLLIIENTYASRQSEVVSKIDAIVAKYNNSLLSGTATLTCASLSDTRTLRTYTFTKK